MRVSTLFTVPVIFVSFVACSGAEDTSLIGGGNGNNPGADGGPIVTQDSGPVNPAMCDVSRCGVVVPQGFTVLTTAGANGTCPAGLTQRDAVTGPSADPSACSCSCNVTQQPDCSKGMIQRNLDYQNSPMCNQQATTVTAAGPGCAQLPNPIQTSGWHYSASMEPTGGACSWDAKLDGSKVKATSVRLCDAPASCPGAACGANVCVAKEGDVACPAAFPKKQLVGKSASAECGSCGACTVEGACGGTLTFYTDYQCQMGKRDFPVDGTCNGSYTNMTYYSFQFQGSLKKSACAGAPSPSTPTAKLDQPSTVCCQK